MLEVNITEFKKHIDKYIEMSENEDIYVIKHGKVVTVLINEEKHKLILLSSLIGSYGKVDENIDYDALIKAEIERRSGC